MTMENRIISNRVIGASLEARGLLPKGCRLIDITIGVTGALVIRYEKYVRADELAQIAEVLADAAREQNPPVTGKGESGGE